MRGFFVLTLALLLACSGVGTPVPVGTKPPAPNLTAVGVHPTATGLWVVGSFTAPNGATAIVDSATATGATAQAPHTLPMPVAKDSFFFSVVPAAGASITGVFSVRATNAGGSSPSVTKPWTYTAPPSAPTVDSIHVYPASAVLSRGAQKAVFYCLYGFMSDGTVLRDEKVPAAISTGDSIATLIRVSRTVCDSLGTARYPTFTRKKVLDVKLATAR